MYEEYVNENGKKKRRKRALPPGLSSRDAMILKSVQRRAHYLDKGFSVCGMRFGWTFIIGIIPIVGDFADALVNYILVVRKARQAEIPLWLVRRMLMNNAVSVVVGAIPIAGDILLAVYKANSRNAALLEEYLRIRGEEYIKRENKKQAGDSKKGENKNTGGKIADKPAPTSDLEQIKPRAGKDTKQVTGSIDAEEGTMPPTKKKGSVLRWRPSSGKGKAKEESKDKLIIPHVTQDTQGERSKFIEDISISGPMDPSKSGTLKKSMK